VCQLRLFGRSAPHDDLLDHRPSFHDHFVATLRRAFHVLGATFPCPVRNPARVSLALVCDMVGTLDHSTLMRVLIGSRLDIATVHDDDLALAIELD
jgi:hypothetical protein